MFNKTFESGANAYHKSLHKVLEWKYVALLAFADDAGRGCPGCTFRIPQGFIPEDDQGYLMVIVQTPQGASLEYTSRVCSEVEKIVSTVPEVSGAFTIVGFGFSGSAPNRAIIFLNLKPFKERKGREHTGGAIVEKLRGPLFGITDGLAIPFNPPAVQGLGQFGGFSFQVEDLGQNSLQTLANVTNQIVGAGNQSKEVTGLFTSFTANDPQYLVNINREKAKSLQVPLNQITDALQVYMGSVYVNDFDFNNRSYRVYLQADQKFRAEAKDMRSYYVKSDTNKMIPLDDVVEIQPTASPQVISHFNLFRSAEIDGSAAPGLSSGQGLRRWKRWRKSCCPRA